MTSGKFLGRAGKHVLLFVGYGAAGVVVTLFAGVLWFGVARVPDLKPWHQAAFHEEFTRADVDRVPNLDAYLKLEDRLFAELRHEVYDRVDDPGGQLVDRYSAGSRADPMAFADNFNRTHVLPVEKPRAGVLMLHGLTDSPYSLHTLAADLHSRGCSVVNLRLPGHGTAPSALTTVDWKDWAAAVRMAAKDLKKQIGPDTPLYFIGYSTGAALAVEYALARLEGEDLPPVDAIVMLSPSIGVDPMAWLAVWQARLSRIPGLGKLAWLDIVPEYDPYKYNSFPVNAGHQVYSVTRVIDERMKRLSASGPVRGFPRTLAFQSVADATVTAIAVINVFLGHLAAGEGHQLVAFDINRRADARPLLRPQARDASKVLLEGPAWPFDLTLTTNEDAERSALVARHRPASGPVAESEPTGLDWPGDIFSLSHVALPISPDDPIYGAQRPADSHTVYLGRLELLGEKGLLGVPAATLMRLRFNPFFAYVEARTMQFLKLTNDEEQSAIVPASQPLQNARP